MAVGNMLGMGNMKTAAIRIFVIGTSATVAKIASDTLVERLFVQTATEATAHPRTADEVKRYQLYRGGIQLVGGALVGKLLWKYQRDAALGIAIGCAVGGVGRVMTAYGWDTNVRDLFSASRSSAGLDGRSPRALGEGRQGYTGPMVRERRTVDMAA